MHCVRETAEISADVAASTTEAGAPSVVVESGRLSVDQGVVKFVPDFVSFIFLH